MEVVEQTPVVLRPSFPSRRPGQRARKQQKKCGARIGRGKQMVWNREKTGERGSDSGSPGVSGMMGRMCDIHIVISYTEAVGRS